MPRWSPSGWRWRVSLKRRIRTSSRASRKTTRGRIPRPSSAPRIAAEGERRVAGPDVEHDRDLGEPLAVGRDELGEVGQQLAGQVVDDRVAEVLEQLGRGGLAAAGQAAEDDDGRLGRPRRTPRPDARPSLGHRPVRWMNEDGQLEQEVHRAAEDERADEVAARRRDGREDRDPEDDDPARRRAAGAEVTIPTRDSPTSRIGNSMTRPKARNIVVTKSKYWPAAEVAPGASSSVKLSRNWMRVRQDDVGDDDPEGEEDQRQRDPRPDRLALARRQARARRTPRPGRAGPASPG